MAVGSTPQARVPRAKKKPETSFDRISGWLTLAANLGVLGGIVLVILQLNQNERIIRAQTRHEIAMGIVELLSETAGNPQLSAIVVKGQQREPLATVERFQFQLRISSLLRIWEDEHYQYRMGLYDEAEFNHERQTWKALLTSSPGIVAQWCQSSQSYSAEFGAEIDGLIGQGACEAAQQQ